MDNITQHFSRQPILAGIFIIALTIILTSIPYYLKLRKLYGSPFEFASQTRKRLSIISCLVLIGVLIYGLTPYIEPPSEELAIVLGNTQNTPEPKMSEDIAAAIEGTMLQQKGKETGKILESIKIISADGNPEVIDFGSSALTFQKIGNNTSNAKRSIAANIKAIENRLLALPPTDNGANYLEAIMKARDNVKEGSRIIVIGSGLSDQGDLNFSQSDILTNEQSRKAVAEKIQEKYGRSYLDQYTVEFYGLGDSVKPQETLSSIQKGIVRDIYTDTIRALSGTAKINTKSSIGKAVSTNFVVGTTDTGCGDIGLIFNDENLKFVGNEATFTDPLAARNSLMTIKGLWDKYSKTIQSIQLDGYIARYAGVDKLSQQRADTVKKALIDLGIPAEKINATGKGFGPYEKDTQNRMVKVTISRASDQCQN